MFEIPLVWLLKITIHLFPEIIKDLNFHLTFKQFEIHRNLYPPDSEYHLFERLQLKSPIFPIMDVSWFAKASS